jgi:methyl-accepting chemotaxis protein
VATEETASSIQNVTVLVQDMATSAQEVTTSIAEMAASIKTVSHDTESLSSAVAQTAAAIEEMAQSIKGVSGNADDLAATSEQTSSSINELAASIEEVGAMTEGLATHGRAERDVDRTDVPVRPRGRPVGTAPSPRVVSDASVSATQLERTSQGLATLARQAGRGDPARDPRCRGRRRRRAAVDRRHFTAARIDGPVVGVMREMGKRPVTSARSSTPST